MQKSEVKKDTHVVLKIEDLVDCLTEEQHLMLQDIIETIKSHKEKHGEPTTNEYIIVNKDEPYADLILEMVLMMEGFGESLSAMGKNVQRMSNDIDKHENSVEHKGFTM